MTMILAGIGAPASAWSAGQKLPVVTSAAVPFYPRVALLAHIEGIVRVRVTTDGAKASTFEAEAGPPMLVQAAEENIRTWRFAEHTPTAFSVTFRYAIREPAGCGIENSSVVLNLPSDVQVNAKGVRTCDPAAAKVRKQAREEPRAQ